MPQFDWINQFLVWLIPIAAGYSLFEAGIFVVSRAASTGVTAIVMSICVALLLVARRYAVRQCEQAAALVTASSLLGAALILTRVQPILGPALLFVPLIVVAMVLPIVNGRLLIGLMITSWVAMVLISLQDGFMSMPIHSMSAVLRHTSVAAATALILRLLWQFRERLTGTLNRSLQAEDRYSRAASGANDGLWDWDLGRDVIYYSERWKGMLGYNGTEIGSLPTEWIDRIHSEDRDRVRAELAVHRDGLTSHFQSEYRMQCANGRYRWMLSRGLAVRNAMGKVVQMAGSQTDITARKEIEEQLRHDALHDALTGLPNRTLLVDRLNRVIARTKRAPEWEFAVLMLDLDRFKVVNDSFGHFVGDELLQSVVQRLRNCLRTNDGLARFGGDEFTIVLDGPVGLSGTLQVAERICTIMREPFIVDGKQLYTSVSIGIAPSVLRYDEPEEILRDADIALYHSKQRGGNCSSVVDNTMHRSAVARWQMESDLRQAIDQNELVVHYQPLVALDTQTIEGFEALVRWQHPDRGLIPPAAFIPVAEETGLIGALGMFVLRKACEQLVVWSKDAVRPLKISVNVSGIQLAAPNCVQDVAAVLAATGVLGCQLQLEITESVMMAQEVVASSLLADLRRLGICVHIDDFGTGYSSLSMLHRLPIDALKIDRSFIQRIDTQEGAHLVQTILTLASQLRLKVIAEGIETPDQMAALIEMGCLYGQGYLFSRPLPADGAERLLQQGLNIPDPDGIMVGPSARISV
ncbi:MAG: hypothetical protein NVS4B8_18480 [Herpetosiphon sp.]